MILPYLSRLLCLILASFFLVNLVTSLLLALFTPLAIRAAQKLAPRRAARLLLTLRLLPFGLGASAALGLCLPSYLWLEPGPIEESVGFPCLFMAMLGAVVGGIAVARGVRAAVSSFRFTRCCRGSGYEMHLVGADRPALVIQGSKPVLALAGIVRPRLVISGAVVSALSEEELSIALRHERAHQISCDNLKRLCMFLTPGILPLLSGFRQLERSWISFTEYAADEAAVAGDARRSLALASALVRVARFGTAPPSDFAISFLGDTSLLSARVDRLLAGYPSPETRHRMPWPTAGPALLVVGCLAAMAFHPSTFRFVQAILEGLIR